MALEKPRSSHAGVGEYGFAKTPQRQGREEAAYLKTLGEKLTNGAHKAAILQGLSTDYEALTDPMAKAGIPHIHAGMEAHDIAEAQRRLNLAHGRPEWFNPLNPQDGQPNNTTFMKPKSDPTSPLSALGPGAKSDFAPQAAATTPLDGLRAPAFNGRGTSPIQSLPFRVPATVESRVTTPQAYNYRGERPVESVGGKSVLRDLPGAPKNTFDAIGGAGIEVDPRRDLTKNWLPAGDSLLPKNATAGVVVDRRYQDPNNPVGFATSGYKPPVPDLSHTAGPIGPATPLDGLTKPNGTPAGPSVPSPVTPAPMRGMGDVRMADSPTSDVTSERGAAASADPSRGLSMAVPLAGVSAAGAAGLGVSAAASAEDERKRKMEMAGFSGF